MSCVNTFPKHSMDGGQYGTKCALPSPPVQDKLHFMTFMDIYGHFLNGKEQAALVHYNYI